MDGSTGELYNPGNTAQQANSLRCDGKVYCLHQGWTVEKCLLEGVGWVCFIVLVFFNAFIRHTWSDVCESGGK